MNRYCFYIDGFNVYYALQGTPDYHKYKWLNYRKLAERLTLAQDKIVSVCYFTSLVHWKQANVARHAQYIRALRLAGVETVQGRFMDKEVRCHLCHGTFWTHEEKRTDVNIALRVVGDAVRDVFDRAVIVSADSDLLSVIQSVELCAPGKQIGVMLPIGRTSFDLRQKAHFRFKMKEQLLQECQFPDEVRLGSEVICRPTSWR